MSIKILKILYEESFGEGAGRRAPRGTTRDSRAKDTLSVSPHDTHNKYKATNKDKDKYK